MSSKFVMQYSKKTNNVKYNRGSMPVTHIEKRRLWIKITIIILFAASLTSFRLLWIKTYNYKEQPYATYGKLDLQDRDLSDGKSVTLEGEWDFHPSPLLLDVQLSYVFTH